MCLSAGESAGDRPDEISGSGDGDTAVSPVPVQYGRTDPGLPHDHGPDEPSGDPLRMSLSSRRQLAGRRGAAVDELSGPRDLCDGGGRGAQRVYHAGGARPGAGEEGKARGRGHPGLALQAAPVHGEDEHSGGPAAVRQRGNGAVDGGPRGEVRGVWGRGLDREPERGCEAVPRRVHGEEHHVSGGAQEPGGAAAGDLLHLLCAPLHQGA